MTEQVTTHELLPTNAAVQDATRKLLAPRYEGNEVQEFLDQATSASAPSPIGATASVNLAVWGKLKCEPDGQPWEYDITVWGGPVYLGSAVGFMYTAYESWDAFFSNVTSAHVQGVDVGGGILQINWFNPSGTPVGQFNGAAGGVGLVEAGGSGKWKHK